MNRPIGAERRRAALGIPRPQPDIGCIVLYAPTYPTKSCFLRLLMHMPPKKAHQSKQ